MIHTMGNALFGFLTLVLKRVRREEGDLGEDGVELWNSLGLLAIVALHWSLGLSCAGGVGRGTAVRQRRRGVEGLLAPAEKRP